MQKDFVLFHLLLLFCILAKPLDLECICVLTKVVQKRVDCNLSKPIMIGQFTMVFSLMDPKERMKSSHCTLVGSPILLVGVARRSYVLNIWSIIFKSASRSWLLIELKKEENGRKTINFSPPLSRGFPEILIVFELWIQVRTQFSEDQICKYWVWVHVWSSWMEMTSHYYIINYHTYRRQLCLLVFVFTWEK